MVFVGPDAVAKGLVDEVASIDRFFKKLSSANAAPSTDDGMQTGGGSLATTADPVGDGIEEIDMSDTTQGAAPAADIVALCHAIGVSTADEFKALIKQAELGRAYEAQTREDAETQAIRAMGVEIGTGAAESCRRLPIEAVIAMRDNWRRQADDRFGIGAEGRKAEGARLDGRRIPDDGRADPSHNGAVRRSANGVAFGASAEGGAAEETAWAKLTPDQQAHVARMGMTGEAREKAAREFLVAAGKAG
jgi:hypothetical protein